LIHIVTGGWARDNSGSVKNQWNGEGQRKNRAPVAAMTQGLSRTAAIRNARFAKALAATPQTRHNCGRISLAQKV
jgi:hypothetical protein